MVKTVAMKILALLVVMSRFTFLKYHNFLQGLTNVLISRLTDLYDDQEVVNWGLGLALLLTGKMGLDFLRMGIGNEKVN